MIAELNEASGMIRLKYRDSDGQRETKFRIKIRTIGEFLQIFRATSNWYKLEGTEDVFAPYIGKLKEAYDKIVGKRRIEYYSKNIDMNRKYRPDISGEYKLVYRPNAGEIFIASRKNKDVTSKYTTFITDEIANTFKQDCKNYGNNKKYILTNKNKEVYDKWASYVHNEYIKLYLKEIRGE